MMNDPSPIELLNQQIKFLRNFPTNKWDVGKQREAYELAYKEIRARLDKFQKELRETEAKFLERGVPETELENWRAGQTNQHLQLLEAVIAAKRHVEWSRRTLREVIDEKIRYLMDQVEH
jgi:hypothetical protein